MTDRSLGRLVKLNLREAWRDEARDFTPWLAQESNLKLLSEALGIELELKSQEEPVGPFSADILCQTGDGSWIVIENQLERTDHTHLGQIITYASGLDAVTVVWIASTFTEEHRAAIDWLNQITDQDHNFIGLEIELWRIGDSPMAPKFNIVSKPNDWTRSIQTAATGQYTDTQKMQLEYWTQFRATTNGKTHLKLHKAQPSNYLTASVGRGGVLLLFVVSTWDPVTNGYTDPYIRAEINLEGMDAKELFAKLVAMRSEIETEVGEELVWYNPENARNCRIWIMKKAALTDRLTWPEQHAWLLEKGELLHRVFTKRLKSI